MYLSIIVARLRAALAVIFMSLVAYPVFAAGDVVISQFYGGGGNSGATLRNDFIELFNRSGAPVSLAGWSIQYASATGSSWSRTNLSAVTLQPGQYYLIQEAAGTGGTQSLPISDATGTIAMSATQGKIALLNTTTSLSCSTGCAGMPGVIDFVGYGGANSFENAAVPTLSNTTAGVRLNGGCSDTDNNNADFSVNAPNPRNQSSAFNPCGAVDQPIAASCPATLDTAQGTASSAALSATDPDGTVVSAAIVSAPVGGISLQSFVPASASGAAATVTLDVSPTTGAGVFNIDIQFANNATTMQTAVCRVVVSVTSPGGSVRIHDIQGAAHRSPREGQTVTAVPAIVIARRSNGFYMQDPQPDSDPATSEGIFVFTASAPTAAVGQAVLVSGTVMEFRPGGSGGTNNLTLTQITSPTVTVQSSGNPLPAATVIGSAGRVPPAQVIDDDAAGDVETSGTFDAALDGIDFYESLEGMRVAINNVVAVGPSNTFGEIPVIGDNGGLAGLRSARGGVVIAANDFNPERILLDDALAATPSADVGDQFPYVEGILDYNFANYKLLVTGTPAVVSGGIAAESTVPQSPDQLAVASFNVENLSPNDSQSKFDILAGHIVNNLRTPDIIGLMEVQDNNGATNDGVVDASVTYSMLIDAITLAGGPPYEYRSIDPVDDQDGGQPGGNIRVGFLFNSSRVTFVDRSGGTSTAATSALLEGGNVRLTFSPGRVDPGNAAFNASRKPLAGEFVFNGHTVFIVANHFNSKGGDQPLFGRFQPPARSSETQRLAQAQIVRDFVQSIVTLDANAKVVVLGDLNDFQFSPAVATLTSGGLLYDLVDTLPANERYTYVFEGNSQVLDHILVSSALYNGGAGAEYDVVHVNSEFASQVSDHDPEVARLSLAPSAVEVTAQMSVYRSGLSFKRSTQTYNGYLDITNTAAVAVAGPLHIRLDNLTSGVTLTNATGTHSGSPYITTALTGLNAGATQRVTVKFSNPAQAAIHYDVRVFSGRVP